MDTLIYIINNDYQDTLIDKKNPKYHLFLESINWWKQAWKIWPEHQMKSVSKTIKNEYKYISNFNTDELQKNIIPVGECKYISKKIITNKTLKKIYELISDFKTEDMDVIRIALMKMYDYNLPSTIKNIKDWKKDLGNDPINKNIINVLIVGAGPLGLFTALYLNNYYNKNEVNNRRILNCYVNILVIDNRIYKEGIKKPYSRSTQFGFNIEQIQPFIKNIFCWKNFGNEDRPNPRRFDFINILENLLYVAAYHENISMYFTKKLEDFNDIKTFMKDENIHYIFDCTGGRLKNTKNLKNDMNWDKFKFKKGNCEIKFNDETKYFEYNENNKLYTNTHFVLELLDKKMRQIKVGNHFGFVTENDDFLLINKFKNVCLKKEDYLILSRYFKSDTIRTLLPFILDYNRIWPNDNKIKWDLVKDENIKYVKITTFNTISRHAPFAATKISKNSTYIKLGDTLGATEYGIKYGMHTSILFSKHICNLLSSVKYF